MIGFVENKNIDWDLIKNLLKQSEDKNQWTNFGPVSRQLESKVKDLLSIDKSFGVVACSSGTSALFSLVQTHNYLSKRELRWVVSAFTFHCQKQGPLSNAIIVDCDKNGILNINVLKNLEFDAVIVTVPFGITTGVREIYDFCVSKNKVIILDMASSFDVKLDFNAEQVHSFHHTKPWGMGEGGIAVVNNENLFRSIINFGICYDINIDNLASNSKMSEFSAAFILQRLESFSEIKLNYQSNYKKMLQVAKGIGFESLCDDDPQFTPFSLPLVSDRSISNVDNNFIKIHKYYKPLTSMPWANNIYNRIIHLPCHSEISEQDLTAAITFDNTKKEDPVSPTVFDLPVNDLKSVDPNETKKIMELLNGTDWPEAVDPILLVQSEEDKKLRADSIVFLFLGDNQKEISFLDVGCDEGHVANLVANSGAKISVGYDIKNDNHWKKNNFSHSNLFFSGDFSEIKNKGLYDKILMYDVLDHVDDPIETLKSISTLLSPNGEISVRCHPWCSKHGGHLYRTKNKAYLHLVLTDEEISVLIGDEKPIFVNKVIHPLDTYSKWFSSAGLKVSSRDLVADEVPSFFSDNPIVSGRIKRNWKNSPVPRLANGIEFPFFQMKQLFVDYKLIRT